ncbi:flagellar basal body P-ring formation chaperone FlgA [Halodurantibacterium flavum]|uniref:Flagella basal body P-ring formation protein FlgA n=1 Tax=Halodurantibacterium flavum TaxID=1382802 RepID=A0ABW4SA83_9RHOB
MIRLALLGLLFAAPAFADPATAARNLRPGTILSVQDITLAPGAGPEVLTGLVGMETRTTIYAGNPVRAADLSSPTLVERNQLVSLVYQRGGLSITTEGRALARGGAGDVIRVMNLASRTTITGQIDPSGQVLAVGGLQ